MPTDKRARQRENRDKQIAERAKAARRVRNVRLARNLLIALAVAAVFYWLTNRSDDDTAASATSTVVTSATTLLGLASAPTDYAEAIAQTTACGGEQPDEVVTMTFDAAEDQQVSGIVNVVLDTSCGTLELALDADTAPESVNSFVFLARQGYFDGTVCHRYVPGFMLQCGDPTGTGTGRPGYTVSDEYPAEGFVYEKGTVAMANSGPGTTGSQFFLVVAEADFLPPQYTVIGTFTIDQDILDALDEIPLGFNAGQEPSGPLETLYLNSVAVQD